MNDRSELELIARRWISLWCAPVDWVLFDRLHADSFQDRSSAARSSSKAAFADSLAQLVSVFPDLETRVEGLVVDEAAGLVAVRWSATGTNRAPFLGIGPTGRQTPITGIEIIEIADRRIIRRWGEWDISAHLGGAM